MTKYGKLNNNVLEYAPAHLIINGTTILNINKDEELLQEYGFKEIVEAEKPNYPYINTYEETETQIIEHIERDTAKEAELAAAALVALQQQFFETSLGYIKRTVTMKDGAQRDFLTGIVPALRAAFSKGMTVSIYTYTIDGQQQQKQVTEEFLTECDNQLYIDFYGENYQESEE